MKQATTIDEVTFILEGIITIEVADNSNLAFFPILYKKVTERIKEGIHKKEFDDNPRMERLDVIFANINKNILLRHLPDYVLAMNQNGLLYLSGFFASDAHELNQASVSLGLCFSHKEEREGWCMLVFKK